MCACEDTHTRCPSLHKSCEYVININIYTASIYVQCMCVSSSVHTVTPRYDHKWRRQGGRHATRSLCEHTPSFDLIQYNTLTGSARDWCTIRTDYRYIIQWQICSARIIIQIKHRTGKLTKTGMFYIAMGVVCRFWFVWQSVPFARSS